MLSKFKRLFAEWYKNGISQLSMFIPVVHVSSIAALFIYKEEMYINACALSNDYIQVNWYWLRCSFVSSVYGLSSILCVVF
jgi:hypothetical protein